MKHILTLAAIPVIILVVYLGYTWISSDDGPPPPEFDYLELQVVRPVAKDAAAAVARDDAYTNALVWVVAEKRHAAFKMLKKEFGQAGKYNLQEPEVPKEKKNMFESFVEGVFSKEKKRPKIKAWLETINAEDVVTGKLTVELTLPGKAPSKFGPYTHSYDKSFWNLDYTGYRIQRTSAWARLLGWLIFVVLLPLVTAPLIRKFVALEKNSVNACVLMIYTFIFAFAGFILKGFTFGGFFAAVLYLGGVFASFLWITIAANKIDEWRK